MAKFSPLVKGERLRWFHYLNLPLMFKVRHDWKQREFLALPRPQRQMKIVKWMLISIATNSFAIGVSSLGIFTSLLSADGIFLILQAVVLTVNAFLLRSNVKRIRDYLLPQFESMSDLFDVINKQFELEKEQKNAKKHSKPKS